MEAQQEKYIDKINTWAIENEYAEYDNKTEVKRKDRWQKE